MKLVYYSSTPYIDCDFPLVRAMMKRGFDMYYLIHLAPYCKNSPLFSFNNLKKEYGIFCAREYPEMTRWGEYLNLDRVYIVNDPKGKTARFFSNLKMFCLLRRFIKKVAPDILHIVESPTFLQFPLSFGIKTIYTIHDPTPHTGEYRKSEDIIRKLCTKTSAGYILLNKRQDFEFCNTYKVPEEKIFHSHLGRYECYENFGTSARIFPFRYFLFFGRVSPYKGVEYAIRAFKSIMKEFPGVHFVIAGGGNAYFVKEIEGCERIKLINRYITNDELSDLIRGSEFVICPYIDATQSGVVQTSYAFSKPVVATTVGNLQEVVRHGKTGFLVKPGDFEDLAKCLAGIFKDGSVLDSMTEEIKKIYGSGPENWNTIADEYAKIYDRI